MQNKDANKSGFGIRKEVVKLGGILFLLILIMMWLSGTFVRKVGPGPAVTRPIAEVKNKVKVERKTYPLVIEQVGTIRAHTEAQVSSRIMAQVKEIMVREGSMVTGTEDASPTTLAKLDDSDFRAKLNQMQSQVSALDRTAEVARAKSAASRAQLESSKANRDKVLADYRRYEDLYLNRAATGQQLEHARAQKQMAEAQLKSNQKEIEASLGEISRAEALKQQAEAGVAEARTQLSYTTIRAPFSGRVIKKTINIGDMVSPGQALFTLENMNRPELHAYCSESLISYMHPGQEMEVHIDALNQTFNGIVREIVPQSDPSTRTVLVKLSLPAEHALVNGLFGRLRITYGNYDAIVVPAMAVHEVGQLQFLNIVGMEGNPERRFVTAGERHNEMIEVLSGLSGNEEVILP